MHKFVGVLDNPHLPWMMCATTTIIRKETEVLAAILLCLTVKQNIGDCYTLLATPEYD